MKQRLKIYLIKSRGQSLFSDEDVLKNEILTKKDLQTTMVNTEIKLYYKYIKGSVPRWYKDYLNQKDSNLSSAYTVGFIFKTITDKDTNYKFIIGFGNFEMYIKKELCVRSFGLKVALSVAESIYSAKLNKISDTMSNIRENAVKKQKMKDFQFDEEKDLLESVIVNTASNDFYQGKISGGNHLSLTTTKNLEHLSGLLLHIMRIYQGNKYKENYAFIDHIKEIYDDQTLIEKIYQIVLERIKLSKEDDVWFSPNPDAEWDRLMEFKYYYYSKPKNKENYLIYDDINMMFLKQFLAEKGRTLEKLEDLKKIKISVVSTEEYEIDQWNMFDCMYASVTYNSKQYVINAGRLYEIEHDFYKRYHDLYLNASLFDSLIKNTKTQKESDYIKEVHLSNQERYIILDQKYPLGAHEKFEICDIFDNEEKMFIHIKKYGSSSFLSHLFSQAKISALLFKSEQSRKEMIKLMQSEDKHHNYDDLTYKNTKIALAIMTEANIPENGHVNVPFFSMINAVTTLRELKEQLNYKDARMMFIPSTAPLYRVKNKT